MCRMPSLLQPLQPFCSVALDFFFSLPSKSPSRLPLKTPLLLATWETGVKI